MKNWEKEFNEIYRRATGEENIVGDLLVKQFIQNLLAKQKEEIMDLITDEIVIAQKEGQPTSRLTSLFNKLSI